MNKSLLQIFKETQRASQSDLARLLNVNRSTISRHASSMDTATDGKIIIHSKNTLIGISEIMDTKLNAYDWNPNTPAAQEFLKLYYAVNEDFKKIMWGE